MCGIAGFVGLPITEAEARIGLRKMCDAIMHRGPDEGGYFVADGIAMGMRRLSIIDVAGGHQPIDNEDGSINVVFNGEIYNHRTLRRELEAAGHRFRTRSDTEVLVHLYEELGQDMVARLHGMFAFAIWDSRQRRLLIARDRSGMKPLSYLAVSGGVIYCSELRSLLALNYAAVRVSSASVMQYLAYGYVPDPGSIFEGVRKLPPGHVLTWQEGGGLKVRRYWAPPRPDPAPAAEVDLVEGLRDRLDVAVAAHLESDVPLGAFLSGGLDSSTVVALMSRHASGRVRTFSIGFAEQDYDESKAAKAIAAAIGTNHTELILRPDVEQALEAFAPMFDEPFADSSAIPTFFVAQLARQSVTVALSGDGGDELFGGYTRYGETLRHSERFKAVRRLGAALGLMAPHAIPGRNRLIDLGRTRWERYAAKLVQPVRPDEGGVARADVPGGTMRLAECLSPGSTLADADFAAAMMRLDFETYLPGDILTKVDRTSMAVSLEARVPLLDYELVDFSLSIPGPMRVTASENKRLFRRAIRGIVPDMVLARPKRGFAVPLGRWFRGPLRHRIDALRNPSVVLREFVDPTAVLRIVREHTLGRRDHSQTLWRLMVLDRWLAALREGGLDRPPALPRLPVA
jgi:asparagine synthase (glutamine-hydrolysing)